MSRPWMPFYVGDYLADTRHLSTAEHGAYVLLILHYWQKEGLPTDEARLARIVGMTTDEWAVSRDTLAAFFDEGWKHGRIEFELTQAARISAAGRAGGEASAKARKNKAIERSVNDRSTIGQALPSPSQLQKEESSLSAPARESESKGKSGMVKKTLLPVGWAPGEASLDEARQLGLTASEIARLISRFINHARQEARKCAGAVGWDAAFANWCDQAAERLGRKPANDQPAVAERPGSVFIREGTDQWDAWQVHLRATTGRGSPIDKNGGWYRPSEWPPAGAAVVRGH